MAIQMRRGANADFDKSKMLAGELAVTTDGTRKVYAAFGANDAKELATKEDVQGIVDNTLTVSGKAADAAVVGEEVGKLSGENDELRADLTEFKNSIGYEVIYSQNRCDNTAIESNKTLSQNGTIIYSDSYGVSDFCYVGDLTNVIFANTVDGHVNPQATYYNIYDENKNQLNDTRLVSSKTGNDVTGVTFVKFTVSLVRKDMCMIYDTSNPLTYFVPFYTTNTLLEKLVDNRQYITLALDGSGDFTSLKSACESIIDSSESKPYTILIKEGIYDVFADFTEVELTTGGNKGFYIPDYTDLIGVGDRDKTIILGELETGKGYAYGDLSPINLNNVHTLKNLTVRSINCRYAVHDDPSTSDIKIKRYVENSVFEKTVYTTGIGMSVAYGSGHRSGADIEFVNCDFSSVGGCGYTLHNNVSFTEPSKIKFESCNFHTDRGSQPSVSFRTLANDFTDYLTLIGCSAERVEFKEEVTDSGVGCCFDARGYANDLGTLTVIGTTTKSITVTNGIVKTTKE